MKNKSITTIFIIALSISIITFSIGLPIYCRFFYFWHIDILDIEGSSGLDKETIIHAFNEVMNFLTLPNKPFSVGTLKYSTEGMNHFYDCKSLFNLNIIAFITSLIIIIILLVLRKTKRIEFYNFKNKTPFFFSGILGIGIPLIIGLLASLDFNTAFTIFHTIFFPGKDNWLFDPLQDQIINILPQEFFRNCGILIIVSIITISAIMLIVDKNKRKKISS